MSGTLQSPITCPECGRVALDSRGNLYTISEAGRLGRMPAKTWWLRPCLARLRRTAAKPGETQAQVSARSERRRLGDSGRAGSNAQRRF